jgi:ATP-binding cassette subfamily F protein uup
MRIEALESRIEALAALAQDPVFYRGGAEAITAHQAEVARVQAELDEAYARWEALERDACS